jgi:hypothetical protein
MAIFNLIGATDEKDVRLAAYALIGGNEVILTNNPINYSLQDAALYCLKGITTDNSILERASSLIQVQDTIVRDADFIYVVTDGGVFDIKTTGLFGNKLPWERYKDKVWQELDSVCSAKTAIGGEGFPNSVKCISFHLSYNNVIHCTGHPIPEKTCHIALPVVKKMFPTLLVWRYYAIDRTYGPLQK